MPCNHATLLLDPLANGYRCAEPLCRQLVATQPVNMGGNSELTEAQKEAALATRQREIQEQFEEYNRQHPEVMLALVTLALQKKNEGFVHYGMKALWDEVRWYSSLGSPTGQGFKLCDIYYSRYARRMMEIAPELDGFFRTRTLRRV